MALTRKFLSALSIGAEQVDEIIAAHTEVTNALKEERDRYKADAAQLEAVQTELDTLKAEAAETDGSPWEEKYNAIRAEFDAYKQNAEAEKTAQAKQAAYRELLRTAGVAEKRIDSILKITPLDDVELENGKVKDADKITANIQKEWADFIPKDGVQGADVANPPAGEPASDFETLSLSEKMKFANANPTDAAVRKWLGKD